MRKEIVRCDSCGTEAIGEDGQSPPDQFWGELNYREKCPELEVVRVELNFCEPCLHNLVELHNQNVRSRAGAPKKRGWLPW